jgi:hypothetical protein
VVHAPHPTTGKRITLAVVGRDLPRPRLVRPHRRSFRREKAITGNVINNAVRLPLHLLAYNLGNFMRTVAMPKVAEPWSLTGLAKKLIGAKVVSHGRYTMFQMAEVAVSRRLFQEILMLIARLRAPPAPA